MMCELVPDGSNLELDTKYTKRAGNINAVIAF